jgi:hypothetical protein
VKPLRLFPTFLLVLAAASGLIVLLGYWVDLPVLISVRDLLVRWAAILAGVAVVVGILNLLYTHWIKVSQPRAGGIYSLVLLIAFVITFLVVAVDTPTGSWSLWIFRYVQLPVETSLLAILAVILVVAAARMLVRRLDSFSLLFLGIAILILVGTTYIPGFDIPVLRSLRLWVIQVPVVAGARGILLGIGLGVVATGVRILLGADRPYEP